MEPPGGSLLAGGIKIISMTTEEFKSLVDAYCIDRKKPTSAQELIYLGEVQDKCPKCGKPLVRLLENGKILKSFLQELGADFSTRCYWYKKYDHKKHVHELAPATSAPPLPFTFVIAQANLEGK